MAVQCEMVIGYLVPHRCENRAVTTCAKCGRTFCDEHVDIHKGGVICTACQQGLDKPVLIADTARTFDEDDMKPFSRHLQDDYDERDLFTDLS